MEDCATRAPATRSTSTANTIVGMYMARELDRRCSGGSRLTAEPSHGQAPESAAAYGRARCERSLATGLVRGTGSTPLSESGASSGSSLSSEMARATARSGGKSKSAEKTGRAALSP